MEVTSGPDVIDAEIERREVVAKGRNTGKIHRHSMHNLFRAS